MDAFDDVWREEHSRFVAQATRTVHDESAAEDIVQEAFRRLAAMPPDEVDDVGAWLSVVVRRLSLNHLRSAYVRREAVDFPVVPALSADADPLDQVTLDDEVRLALEVVLDRLTPAERTSFVLHDVFGFPFDAVAAIVGRTPAACRQLATRARRSIRTDAPHDGVAPAITAARHPMVVDRFIAACAGGDISELMAALDPSVDGHAELIGFGTIVDATGRPTVAQRLVGMFGPGTGARLVPVSVEGEPGVVVYVHDRLAALVRLDVEAELIRHLRAFVLAP
jgi:RNA polymerase sigma-70 factor (ECF subfamily)